MYKLLALDLDGTVLNSEHKISAQLVQAIQQISQVHHVVIVTGRHHVAAAPYYHELGLSTPIICCNGTYIYDYHNKKVLSEKSIDKSRALDFIKLAKQFNLKMVMYSRDSMLYSTQQPVAYMEKLSQWANNYPVAERPSILQVDSFTDALQETDYIWKFVVEGGEVDSFNQTDFINNNFNGERSWVDRVDFANKGNSKGNALSQYALNLGIEENQIVAVGDNHNDISMLQLAGLGVAMDNAEPEVKQHAQHVTSNNDHPSALAQLLLKTFL